MATKKHDLNNESLEARLLRMEKLDKDIEFTKRFFMVAGKAMFYIGGGLYGALSFFTSTKEFWRSVLRDFLK